MTDNPEIEKELEALGAVMEAIPENFRMVAQIYTDQLSLTRRTMNAVLTVISAAEASGPSVLFDFSNDPLKALELSDNVIEIHTRIVDLLVMAAFGQKIEISEFQDYAKALVPLYADFDFTAKVKNSALKEPVLQELEQEWLKGTDFTRIQGLFKVATASTKYAAGYCGQSIGVLPEF